MKKTLLCATAAFAAGSALFAQTFTADPGYAARSLFNSSPDGSTDGTGFVITGLLSLLRMRLPAWPFHPMGYALANTPTMASTWMPFLIAWLLKSLVLRYGGMGLYRRSLPFFLGLILGDYVVPSLWFLLGWATNTQMYLTFPH